MYKPADSYTYRPNTKKLYEDYYKVKVPEGYEVHHILPVRLGGTHDIENLTAIHESDHALAHLRLFETHGDPRDLCAYHMISGRNHEAHLVACAAGGRASQIGKKERGELNGFQLFDEGRRKAIASKAGSIGGTKQRDLGIGIHVDEKTRVGWAKLGAAAVAKQFTDPVIQASRGKRGGVKNKGARHYNDGVTMFVYTSAMSELEPFDAFIERTGMKPGKFGALESGSKYYNDGEKQWVFQPSKHSETFEEFLEKNNFYKGRLK